MVVIGLGKNLLLKSILGHCVVPSCDGATEKLEDMGSEVLGFRVPRSWWWCNCVKSSNNRLELMHNHALYSWAHLLYWGVSCLHKSRTNSLVITLRAKWYFVTKIVLTYCEKKIVLVIEKSFWSSRLQAENLQKFWDCQFWSIKKTTKRGRGSKIAYFETT